MYFSNITKLDLKKIKKKCVWTIYRHTKTVSHCINAIYMK